MKLGYVLRRHHTGAGLLLIGDDADLETAGNAVHLQPMQRHTTLRVGDRHLGAESVRERAAGAFVGQVKTDGRGGDGPAGLVRHLDRERPRAAAAGGVDGAFAFHNLDLQDRDLSNRGADKRYS